MSEVMAAERAAAGDAALEQRLSSHLAALDGRALRKTFIDQHEFVHVPGFLPPSLRDALITAAAGTRAQVNRNYLPGHKKGGSVSRHAIDMHAAWIAQLYRTPALIGWFETLCGRPLQASPDDDPHAYALYYYTEPGDHIGWHYDTSYYKGARYTVLIGVEDRSSCRLDYRLHTRNPGRAPEHGSIALAPGAMAIFNGDTLQHRITPLGDNEFRVSLTLEYVTDPRMGGWSRFISNMKDAVAYFGFRQVFRRGARS